MNNLPLVFIIIGSFLGNNIYAEEQSYPYSGELPNFGVNLFLVKDEQKFLEEWAKPTPPHIEIISRVKVGEQFSEIVLFWGGETNSNGQCQIFLKTKVLDHNKIIASGEKQPVCVNRPPPPKGIFGLSDTVLNLSAAGEPTKLNVEITVTDLVSGQVITVGAPVEVVK